MKTLKAIIDNPFLSLVVSLVLLVTSLLEAWDTLFVDIRQLHFRAHHGLMLFALLNTLKALPDTVEGIEYLVKSQETTENAE